MEPISYFNALLADPHITTLQILHMQQPVAVARAYVPLRLSEEWQQGYDTPVSDEESTETAGADDATISIEEERQRRERHAEAVYDPEKAIRTFQRCVVMGDAGAGKTTLLRYLAITAAQRSIVGIRAPLPVYVDLPSFVHSGLPDVLDFVSAAWERACASPAAELRVWLANSLDEGKALLLLDALDEAIVEETPEAAERSYEALSQAILTLASRYPVASLVVTVRKASYRQRRPLVSFTALEVMDFRPEDVKQFVQNWYDATSTGMSDAFNGTAAQKGADLIKLLDAKPHLEAMAANPLLLTLMVLAYEDRLNLAGRRAELYRMCIATFLTKRDSRQAIRRPGEFGPEQKFQLLKVIAWHFHHNRQRFFTERDLLQVISEFLPAMNVSVERNRDMLQAIAGEQEVLREQAPGWYSFLHISLQEYLAAEYINEHQEYAELYLHRADPWWEEVLLFYMEITPDASLFLQQLCAQNSTIREDIFSTNLLLAGRCLAVHPAISETGVRTQIIQQLFELLKSTPYSFLRQEAIRVLCGIADVETNSKLVTLLSDEQLDIFVRWNIADALGRSGEREVASELVRLLPDERLNVFVRWTIADALGGLGERSVTAELVSLLSDERLDVELRRGIADAVGMLSERSVASELVQLLSDERLHTELRRDIAGAVGKLGEQSVAGDLVQLLVNEQLDVSLRKSIARTLGTLGERSVVEDLVSLLADEWLDVDLRRSIADALAALGEWSLVANAMVELLADDRQDMFVRRSITGALGTLAEVSGSLAEGSERSLAQNLVQLLADEGFDADLRKSIADVLGMLGERSVVRNLVQLLTDDEQDVHVRIGIADALGRLGERSVAARAMIQLLADDRQDSFVLRSIVDTLARLGDRSVAGELVRLLSDDRLDADLQWRIATTLGSLGERSVAAELTKLLANERLDVHVRRSIAIALGMLGERSVAAREMVRLLASDQFGVFAQRSIADALGKLGERSVAGELVQLLADEKLHEFVRCSIADALGRLGENAVAWELAQLLADERLDVSLRRSIAGALAAFASDISIVERLVESLQDKKIFPSVYRALWAISRRAGVWIFPVNPAVHTRNVEKSQAQYEIVRWQQARVGR